MARETTRKTASEVWQEAKNEQFAQDVKKVNSDYLAMYDKAVSGFVNNSRKNSPYDPYRSRSLAQEALSDIAYREQVIEAYYEKNRRRLGEDQYSAGLRKLAYNRSSAQNVMGAYNAAAAFYPQQQKVDDYLERAMSYYNSAQTDLDSMTWANASDVYGRRSSAADALKAENDDILEWLEKNRVTLGEQNYNSLKQQFEDIGSGYDDVVSVFGNNADFYGKFATEDDYLKWDAYSTPEKRQATYQKNMDRLDVLREERRKIQGRVNTYRAGTNPYASGGLHDYKSDIQKLDAIDKEINALEEEISMFEDYERSARSADYMQKYSGKSYNELMSLLPDIKDEEEREWVSQYAPSVMTMLDYNSSIENAAAEIDSLEKVINEYNIITSGYGLGGEEEDKKINSEATKFLNSHGFRNIKEAEIRLEELKTTQWDLSNRKKYAFLDTNQDFDTIAGDIADSRTAGFGIGFGTNWWGFGDPVYDYINDIDGTRKEYVDTSDVQHPYTIYDMMYDDEIMKYNYLYNTEGKDSADKYLDYLEYTLNERRMGIARGNAAILANKHPFAASALSVPYNLVSGIGFADIAGQNLLKNIAEGLTGEYIPVDYNSGAMGATVFNSTVRGTVAQNIANKHGVIELDKQAHPILSKVFNGKSLGDVYQLGMSMADSATTALLAPVIGTGATALLGGSAASQGVLDAVSRGATDEQALMMGIVNGACEMFFEKYSLEQLLKGDTRNIVMAFLKQGFAEGSEEFNTTVANNLADIFIMAKNSGYQRNVDKYIDQGLSPEEAEKMAFWDAAIQAGWDFVGGFASGGIMGSVSTRIQNYQNQNAEAFRIYGADPGALVSEALEIDPDNAYAQKMQNRLEAGKQLSGGQLNRLVKQNEAALYAQDIYTIQSAAEARLTDLGETGDVSSIAAALTKQAAGRKLTRAEQKVIANSKHGKLVANEMNTEWVENIGTNRINAQEYNRPAEAAQLPQKAVKNTGYSKMLSPKSTPVEAPAETVPANRDSADDIDGLESTYAVSEDGKAHLISNPEQSVDIVGFSSAKDGKVMLRTSDGEVVPADDVSYANESQAIVFETIANMGIPAKSANILLQGFMGKEGIDAEAYAKAIQESFEYGRLGIPESELNLSSALTASQRDYVYRQGRKAAGKQVAKEQSIIRKEEKTSNGEKRTGTVHFDRKGRTFDAVRETSLKTLEQLAAGLGIDIYVYESYENESGDRVYLDDQGNEVEAPNGFYDPSDGSIHIDLNAGQDGKGIILFTASHELVHFIRQWSPAKFKVLANFLVEQYHKKGASVSDLIQQQKDKAKQNGRQITTEEAFEEMVADSMETMLVDGNVVQMMAELKQRDKTLWQKICDWFRDLVADLQQMVDAYKGVKPESTEGRMVADMKDAIAVFQSLYVDALDDASESFRTTKNTTGEGGVKMQPRQNGFINSPEIQTVQNIGRRSIFDLPSKDLVKLEKFAKTYWNTMKVKSPFFRSWFGDWRLNDHKTIVEVARKRGDAKGSCVNIDTDWTINISGHVFSETKNHFDSYNIAARKYLPYIRDIVEKAILLDTHGMDPQKIKSENSLLMHSLYAIADIGKGPEVLKLYVEEMNNPNRSGTDKRVYQLQNIEKYRPAARGSQNNASPISAAPTGIGYTVSDLAQYVKSKDADYSPQYPSKIVNADGSPKIMYHGSHAQFTVFDRKKAKSSGLYGTGFYFTDSDAHAGTYGNLYKVYLNVRNPLKSGEKKVSRAQVRKFLEAVAENEDYSIENYGTYDIDSILRNVMGGKTTADAFRVIQDVSATAIGDMVEAAELFNSVNDTEFDGIIVPTETVVFRPEQIKSATDNIGTFDGSNPDIRYSTRNKAANDVSAAIQKENAQLKEDVQQLKELLKLQRTVTGGTKFTKSSVESMAKILMQSNNAKGDRVELANLLNDLYEYIATEKDLTWEDVAEKAQSAVDWIRKHTVFKKERSQYTTDILHTVRTSRIALSETQKGEAAYRFGSVNDYRKSMMGSVVIANDGVPLDIQWQEWSTTYPDIFDAEITAADMPGALADVIASLRNSDLSMTEYAYHADMIEQDILRQVYDGFWRVSTLRTVADVKQREINELKSKHYQKMNDLRQKHQEASEKMKEAQRERIKKLRQEYRDSADKRIQDIKDRHKATKAKMTETRAKREATTKLRDLVLDTARWIDRPKKVEIKVPDVLKKPYADFLNSIDLSSKRLAAGGDPTNSDLRLANAMSTLATTVERITAGQDPTKGKDTALDSGYLDLPADFVQRLRDMTESITAMMDTGDHAVNAMSAQEVKELSKMIRTLNHAIREVSTLYANMRFANVQELGRESMGFMDGLGEIDTTRDSTDFIVWDNALPFYAFKRFGAGGESVFEGLMDAQDKLSFLSREIFAFQKKTWNEKDANAWSEDTHTIQLPSGNSLTLTTADAMSIYCLSRRRQGLQHLLGGGVRVIGIQKGSKKAKDSRTNLTMEDIDAIVDSLDSRQKKVAEAIQEFMSSTCAEWGNEISMKRFLTREFTEEHYFPIESNTENMTTQDPTAQQSDLFRLLNISATKALTPNANNEVIIRNVFDVFAGHASDMARLNAFGMPLLDYMKWLNYREKTINDQGQIDVKGVRKSMEKAYGNAAKQYVMNLIKDVNGRASDGGDPTPLMKWMRSAKTAMVGNSLRVATLQMTSYPRASLVLSFRNLALGLSKKPNIEKAKKYCGIALWKSFGFYDTNISRSIEEQMKGITDPKQKLIEWSLKGAEIGDALTWGYLWNACEYEVAATKKYKVGSEEFNEAVGKKLREVVYRTQVVDSTLTRSQLMRSKRGMAQEAAAFMSEATLSANILMDAGFEFNMEKRRSGSAKVAWEKTGKYIGKAIAVYSIGQLTAALLESLWDAWRDDDDEKFVEKYLAAFRENLILDILPFNKIPIVADVFEAVLSLAGIGFYSSDRMTTTWITDAWSAVDAWKDYFGGESNVTAYGAIFKSVKALSSYYGVSGSGFLREGVALWNNTAGAYDSTLKIRQRTLSKSQLGGEYLDAVIAGNDRQAETIAGQFVTDEEREKAIRAAIKSRFTSGEIGEQDAAKYLILYGGLDASDAHWNIEKWVFDMSNETGESYHKYDDFLNAVKSGENLDTVIDEYLQNGVSRTDLRKQITNGIRPEYINATEDEREKMRDNLLAAMQACGYTEEDAKNTIGEWNFEAEYGFDYSERRTAYLSGELDEDLLKKALVEYGGYDPKDAEIQVQIYDWEAEGYENVTTAAVRDYNEYCAASNVPKDIYMHIRKFANSTENDVVNGEEVTFSAVKKIMREINAQQGLTPAQKTALARSIPRNWKDSTIEKYKLW